MANSKSNLNVKFTENALMLTPSNVITYRLNFNETLPQAKLVYDQASHAFDVRGTQKNSETAAILVGKTIQLEMDINGRLLYAWGYSPREGWADGIVTPPDSQSGSVYADTGEQPERGIAYEDSTIGGKVTFDKHTSWCRIGDENAQVTWKIEIEHGAVLGFDDAKQLQSVWLRVES